MRERWKSARPTVVRIRSFQSTRKRAARFSAPRPSKSETARTCRAARRRQRENDGRLETELELSKRRLFSRCVSHSFSAQSQKQSRPLLEISSAVVCLPMENRMADLASASGRPMASKTCDASTLPTMQAEPLDAQTPSRSSAISMVSESSSGRLTFNVFANRQLSIAI